VSSCLRHRGHCDRPALPFHVVIFKKREFFTTIVENIKLKKGKIIIKSGAEM
jgi:hypothetical protein